MNKTWVEFIHICNKLTGDLFFFVLSCPTLILVGDLWKSKEWVVSLSTGKFAHWVIRRKKVLMRVQKIKIRKWRRIIPRTVLYLPCMFNSLKSQIISLLNIPTSPTYIPFKFPITSLDPHYCYRTTIVLDTENQLPVSDPVFLGRHPSVSLFMGLKGKRKENWKPPHKEKWYGLTFVILFSRTFTDISTYMRMERGGLSSTSHLNLPVSLLVIVETRDEET